MRTHTYTNTDMYTPPGLFLSTRPTNTPRCLPTGEKTELVKSGPAADEEKHRSISHAAADTVSGGGGGPWTEQSRRFLSLSLSRLSSLLLSFPPGSARPGWVGFRLALTGVRWCESPPRAAQLSTTSPTAACRPPTRRCTAPPCVLARRIGFPPRLSISHSRGQRHTMRRQIEAD